MAMHLFLPWKMVTWVVVKYLEDSIVELVKGSDVTNAKGQSLMEHPMEAGDTCLAPYGNEAFFAQVLYISENKTSALKYKLKMSNKVQEEEKGKQKQKAQDEEKGKQKQKAQEEEKQDLGQSNSTKRKADVSMSVTEKREEEKRRKIASAEAAHQASQILFGEINQPTESAVERVSPVPAVVEVHSEAADYIDLDAPSTAAEQSTPAAHSVTNASPTSTRTTPEPRQSSMGYFSSLLQMADCPGCAEKETEIRRLHDLLRQKGNVPNSVDDEHPHKKQDKPKTGHRVHIQRVEWVTLQPGEERAGFKRMVDDMPVAVPAEWFVSTMSKLKRKAPSMVIKRLMDNFMSPWDYGLEGGRSEFSKTQWEPLIKALEVYGIQKLSMSPTDSTRAINEKMASGRRIVNNKNKFLKEV